MCAHLSLSNIYIYIYIHIERERGMYVGTYVRMYVYK